MNKEEQRKIDNRRRDIAGVAAIIIGLLIGLFIKRVKVGLLLGLVIGFIAITLLNRRR